MFASLGRIPQTSAESLYLQIDHLHIDRRIEHWSHQSAGPAVGAAGDRCRTRCERVGLGLVYIEVADRRR